MSFCTNVYYAQTSAGNTPPLCPFCREVIKSHETVVIDAYEKGSSEKRGSLTKTRSSSVKTAPPDIEAMTTAAPVLVKRSSADNRRPIKEIGLKLVRGIHGFDTFMLQSSGTSSESEQIPCASNLMQRVLPQPTASRVYLGLQPSTAAYDAVCDGEPPPPPNIAPPPIPPRHALSPMTIRKR